MDDLFLEKTQIQVLDFATDKRLEWEKNHQLYSVIFELTPKCNFNCIHCYLHDHHSSKELSYEEIIEIIDLLYEKEVLFLTFTGGDIFTRKDFLDIYLYSKQKGFIIELYTNGALITPEVIEVFAKYPPLLVDISMYGASDNSYKAVTGISGAYDRVAHNILALHEAGIRVSLKAPMLSPYYHELDQFKDFAKKHDLPFRSSFEIFTSIDNDDSVKQYSISLKDALRDEFTDFSKKPKRQIKEEEIEWVNLIEDRPLFRCKLGRASCVIDYEGRMCPCMSFRHAGTKLTAKNFDEVWASFREYQKMKAKPDYKCLRCKAYDYCDICPAMMEFVYGDLEHVDEHFCKSAKARYAFYEQGKSIEEAIANL